MKGEALAGEKSPPAFGPVTLGGMGWGGPPMGRPSSCSISNAQLRGRLSRVLPLHRAGGLSTSRRRCCRRSKNAPAPIPAPRWGAPGCSPPASHAVPLFQPVIRSLRPPSRAIRQHDGPAGAEAGDGAAWPRSPPCAVEPALAVSPRAARVGAAPSFARGLGGRGLGAPAPAGGPAALPGAGDGAGGSCGRQLPAGRARVCVSHHKIIL